MHLEGAQFVNHPAAFHNSLCTNKHLTRGQKAPHLQGKGADHVNALHHERCSRVENKSHLRSKVSVWRVDEEAHGPGCQLPPGASL